MPDYWYPVAFSHWGPEENAAIDRVRKSNQWTIGQETALFESEFAEYHGMKYGVGCNSGSSANLLMIAALFACGKLKAGDTALVPALAWSTTYSPLVQYGMNIVLLDCDEGWNAPIPRDEKGLERHIDAKLVVGCSILGNPAYLTQWSDYAKRVGAVYIEDNAESIGARFAHAPQGTRSGKQINWKLTGTLGLMNSYSMFYSHQLSAIEGGMVLTNDEELANLCRMLRDHGMVRGGATIDDQYDFRLMGYNLRPLELHAAIAREQLKKLEGFRRQREQNANNFDTWALGLPISVPKRHGIVSPFGIQFRVKNRETRLKLANELRAVGIDCRMPTGGSFTQHAYGRDWAGQPTPNADIIHMTGMFLGNGPIPLDEQIQRAVKVMREVL